MNVSRAVLLACTLLVQGERQSMRQDSAVGAVSGSANVSHKQGQSLELAASSVHGLMLVLVYCLLFLSTALALPAAGQQAGQQQRSPWVGSPQVFTPLLANATATFTQQVGHDS